jgi:hypothetical protein
MSGKDGMDSEAGKKNLDAAVSGEIDLDGANRDQIEAMGGEIDEIDEFTADAIARGDILPDDIPDEPDADSPADEDEPEAGDEGDAGEEPAGEEEASDEDEPEGDEPDDPDDQTTEDEPDEKPAKVDDQRIPKSRFDEVNARRKAAEDKLAEFEAQAQAGEDATENKFDFEANETEYMELLLSGKTKEAAAKRTEIRAAEKAEWTQESVHQSTSTVQNERVQNELDAMVEDYEAAYNEFNADSDEYSEDIVGEVDTFYRGYRSRQDLTPQAAFKLALDTTIRLYGLKKVGAEGEGETTETPKKTTVRKKKVQTKKKIELAKKAPKDTGATGDAGDSVGDANYDINNMTDAELDALPESTLKRLRGDTL